MAFDFSTLVTDRKQSDVAYVKQLIAKLVDGTATEAEKAEWNSFTLKGSYNHTDLNRVNAAMEELKSQLESYGYGVPNYRKMQIPHTGAPNSGLPSDYTAVKYLCSSGTQLIDTGVYLDFSNDVDVEISFKTHTTKSRYSLINSFSASGVDSWGLEVFTDNRLRLYWNMATVSVLVGSITAGNVHTARFTWDAVTHTYTLFVDGEQLATGNYEYSGTTPYTVRAFLDHRANGGSTFSQPLSVYALNIQNGSVARRYVPCVDSSDTAGMYDLANGVFYTNNGTGSFIVGHALPRSYTRLTYIESSGTQYIDTEFKPTQNTRVVMDFHNFGDYGEMTTGLCPLLGARNASTTSAFALWIGTKTYPHYGNVAYNKNGNFTTDLNNRLIYDFNKNVVSIGNDSITCASATFTTDYNLCLLTINNYGNIESRKASGKLYSCQIYDNGTLVRNFVPCINPDGAYGLYDVVNAQFYGNAGTDSFTGGAVVEWDAISNEQIDYDPYLWYEIDIPTPQLMENYLANVQSMRNVLELFDSTPATPDSMSGLTYSQANAIEQILFDIDKAIKQTVGSFTRLNAFTAWAGNRPLPSVDKDIGRTWAELGAMQTTWRNWDVATWFLLLHGNLKAVETEV